MGQDNQYLWFVNINLVLAEWIIQFVSLKIAIVSPKIANLSLKIARKYHRKLQAQSILIHDKKNRGKHRVVFPSIGGHFMEGL